MSTTQGMRPVRQPAPSPSFRLPASRMRRRLRNYIRTIFARGDFSSLLMTWALLIVTALAVDAAEWTTGLRSLVGVSFFAVGFGFLLARSHYSELVALLLSTFYSLAVVVGVSAVMLVDSGSFPDRVYALVQELDLWISAAAAGNQPTHDDTAFVVFLSILFWYLGHNAAWHIFRVDRVWRVIILTGLVLITNQFYYQGQNSLDIYLIAFVVLSLLLLIRSHIETREFDWYLHRVNFPTYVRRAFFYAGGALALLVVLVAWVLPTGADDKSLDRINELLSSDPVMEMAEIWNRLFSSLEGQGIATSDYYGGEELQLSGAIQLGNDLVMRVEAPPGPRYYWRSTVYDTYNFNTWEWNHYRAVRAYTDESGLQFNIGPDAARQQVRQTFQLRIRSSRLIYAAPQPITMGLPVEAELNCLDDMGRTCVNENRPSDVAIIRARDTLRAGDSYSVTSAISLASADDLRNAGQVYPDWVLRQYLQGATEVSPTVRNLAAQIVSETGAQTPYDQAKAIEYWLRTNIAYNESIPTPPSGGDPIEWFLFERQEGYCNYYASAMVLMLRSQGIPARLAAGFAQGTWDANRGSYEVLERDAHTWVEVYFPGYGWIEFEPTSDEPAVERQGDQTPQAIYPSPTPMPTATFTPTMTPTLQSPTQEGGVDATPTGQVQAPFIPSTPTPAPTVTPAPTQTPPQDVTRIGGDEEPNIGKILVTTLLVVVIVIALLLGGIVFAIWYVEYRGLGDLNGVQRAYARLGIYGRWLGLRFEHAATPDERRRHMISEVPEGEQPINTITKTYIQDRYAPPMRREMQENNAQAAQESWQDARWIFIKRKIGRWLGKP